MVQVNLPNGSSIVYSYDHSGKRIAKTAGGVTIDYYFDGDDLITEAQGANILAYYTQGQGLLSQRRNNASYFYHYDGLGSTKALTDANQNIQNTTKYDAWGNILQSSGTITNPYLYMGISGFYGETVTSEAITYSFPSSILRDTTIYNPVLGYIMNKRRKQSIPPIPPDWPWGNYGKWQPTCNPYQSPIFEHPANCQQEAWNDYIKCMQKKWDKCYGFCATYSGVNPKEAIELPCLPMPSPPSHYPPLPPMPSTPGFQPNPPSPLEQIAEELTKLTIYLNCMYYCLNTAGTFAPTEELKVTNLPNCISKAREKYKECCKRSK